MSLISLSISDSKVLLPVLERIATALERIAPEPSPAPDHSLKPEEAVSYVDEEQLARQEVIDEMGEEARRLKEYADLHPEEFGDV